MDDLPPGFLFLQHYRTSVQKPGTVIKMEGNNADVSGDLEREVPGLNIHVRALGSAAANAIKYLLKILLIFCSAFGVVGKFAWVEDGGVVGEVGSKSFPVQVIECLNEGVESFADP